METLKQAYSVQVVATDIDSRAITSARAGLYPASIAADISPERLARFFTPEADGGAFRIRKGIRDMVVFSEQDLIKDPPFSRLDLISCRNLLIYMGGDLQKRLMPLFHYTLNPGGMLFLGTSETVGEFANLFTVLDLKAKLYKRKQGFDGAPRMAQGRFMTPMSVADVAPPQAAGRPSRPGRLSLRELTEQALLKQIGLSGVLVSGQGDILYLHGRTGAYLEPAPGEARISNILKMAREGLRRELATALHKVVVSGEIVCVPGLRVKTNGHFSSFDLTVRPVTGTSTDAYEAPLYLVVMEEASIDTSPRASTGAEPDQHPESGSRSRDGAFDEMAASATIAALNEELRANEEYLQAANEELETSNEELKSSNEEMQSVNEELQSTNEELETSKEEMQSINEELSTVNGELQVKVADLSRASNDMNNLMSSTGIGTVFVDHQLRIMRFTPAATRIINLIPSDVGRPVAHTVSNLVGYNGLVADAKGVLDTLVPKEVDVQTTEGAWYRMRIQPYRTLDNVIEGAVITFVDITEIVETRDALRKANELLRLAVVVRDAHDAITVQDLDGRILAWNPGAVRMYGWTEAEALSMNVRDRIPLELKVSELALVHQLSQKEVLEPYRTQRVAKDGSVLEISMTSTALFNEAGTMYAVATTERARGSRPDHMIEAEDGRQD
jgi:two-component system CheB/CheR fusion protein